MWQFKIFGVQCGIGRSKTKLMAETDIKTNFADIVVVQQAETEMQELVNYLKHPDGFESAKTGIFSGVIIVGASGTDKSLSAKVLAGEAGATLFRISGPDFVEEISGVAASRIHDTFIVARKHAPCVIFIDDIGAFFAGKGQSDDRAQQEPRKQLLLEIDSDTNKGIILVAGADSVDQIDRDWIRPSRFNRGFRIELNPQSIPNEPQTTVVYPCSLD